MLQHCDLSVLSSTTEMRNQILMMPLSQYATTKTGIRTQPHCETCNGNSKSCFLQENHHRQIRHPFLLKLGENVREMAFDMWRNKGEVSPDSWGEIGQLTLQSISSWPSEVSHKSTNLYAVLEITWDDLSKVWNNIWQSSGYFRFYTVSCMFMTLLSARIACSRVLRITKNFTLHAWAHFYHCTHPLFSTAAVKESTQVRAMVSRIRCGFPAPVLPFTGR